MKNNNVAYLLLGAAAVYLLTQQRRGYSPQFQQLPPPPPRNRAAEYQAWINLVLSTYGNISALWQPGGPFYQEGIPQNAGANYTGSPFMDYSNIAGKRIKGRSFRTRSTRRLYL